MNKAFKRHKNKSYKQSHMWKRITSLLAADNTCGYISVGDMVNLPCGSGYTYVVRNVAQHTITISPMQWILK